MSLVGSLSVHLQGFCGWLIFVRSSIYFFGSHNFQESTTILNACIKKIWKLIEGTSYMLQTSTYYQNIAKPLTHPSDKNETIVVQLDLIESNAMYANIK